MVQINGSIHLGRNVFPDPKNVSGPASLQIRDPGLVRYVAGANRLAHRFQSTKPNRELYLHKKGTYLN